jgi:hypothetical protein
VAGKVSDLVTSSTEYMCTKRFQVYDNYGPKVLVYTGVFLHLFGMMMCSISTEYYQFILSQGTSPLSHTKNQTINAKNIQACAPRSAMQHYLPRHSARPAPGSIRTRLCIWHPAHRHEYRRRRHAHLPRALTGFIGIRLGYSRLHLHQPRSAGHCSTDRDLASAPNPETRFGHRPHPPVERRALPDAQWRLCAVLPRNVPAI